MWVHEIRSGDPAKTLEQTAMLAFVRNSIGADSYVWDEIILSQLS